MEASCPRARQQRLGMEQGVGTPKLFPTVYASADHECEGLTESGAAVLQGNDKLGPLPQTLQEGHHQAAHIVGVVGGEGVLVLLDGRQGESSSTGRTIV